jgi:hypothetical protein
LPSVGPISDILSVRPGEEFVSMNARLGFLPLLLAAALVWVGCAPKRPVLYPNRTLEEVGYAAAQRDIDECLAFAKAYGLQAQPEARTAKSTVAGGAVGGAVGAASGAVRGEPGRRAGTWAAGGAAAGFMRGLFRWRDPDPIQARFVQICLREQGYQVIGWR